MEETKKLYSLNSITLATFFGGPAAAGYLIKKNYETYNQKEKGKKAFVIGIICTILIFGGIFTLPEHVIDKIPNALIPTFYTGIIYFIVYRYQGNWLKEHKMSGGEFYSGWKATGIGALFLVVLAVIIFGAIFITDRFSSPNFDFATYDKGIAKFGENENKAVEVFEIINVAEPNYLVEELEKGILLWNENKQIISNLNKIENLPEILKKQNAKILKYCDLRIKHNETVIKSVTKGTNLYDNEIYKIGMEINNILKELDDLH